MQTFTQRATGPRRTSGTRARGLSLALSELQERDTKHAATPPTPTTEHEAKRGCPCGGGCAKCARDGFQDDDSDVSGDSEPVSTPTGTRISCLELVSFAVTTRAPRVSDTSGACRLELGHCSTPRGSCGSTADSGATFTAVVRAAEDCAGELRFAQNVTSSARRRTPTGGEEECLSATGNHKDGGIPWKGCAVSVNTTGDHTITSDDCPNIRLSTLDAASAHDEFKTYLLWKAAGSPTSVAIANAEWEWEAATRRTGTSGRCASDWQAPGGAGATFTGAVSTDSPVGSPDIQDVEYGPCGSDPEAPTEGAPE